MGTNNSQNFQQPRSNIFSRRKKEHRDKWSASIKTMEHVRIVNQIINDISRRNFNAADQTTQFDFLDENIVSIIGEVCVRKIQYLQTIFDSVMAMRATRTNDMNDYSNSIMQFRQGLVPCVKVYDPEMVVRCDNISNFINKSIQTWCDFKKGYDTYVINSRSMGRPDVTQLINLFNFVSNSRSLFNLDEGMYNITRY